MNTEDFKRCLTPLMELYAGQWGTEFCSLQIEGVDIRLVLMKVEYAQWVTVIYYLPSNRFKADSPGRVDMLKNNYLMALNATMPASFGLDPTTAAPVLTQRMDWTGCAPLMVQEHIVAMVKGLLSLG